MRILTLGLALASAFTFMGCEPSSEVVSTVFYKNFNTPLILSDETSLSIFEDGILDFDIENKIVSDPWGDSRIITINMNNGGLVTYNDGGYNPDNLQLGDYIRNPYYYYNNPYTDSQELLEQDQDNSYFSTAWGSYEDHGYLAFFIERNGLRLPAWAELEYDPNTEELVILRYAVALVETDLFQVGETLNFR